MQLLGFCITEIKICIEILNKTVLVEMASVCQHKKQFYRLYIIYFQDVDNSDN